MEFKRRKDGSLMGGAPQAKWAKKNSEWEDSPSQFEEELSMFFDADMDIEDQEAQASHDVIPVGVYCTENHTILNLTSFFNVYPVYNKSSDLNLPIFHYWKRVKFISYSSQSYSSVSINGSISTLFLQATCSLQISTLVGGGLLLLHSTHQLTLWSSSRLI